MASIEMKTDRIQSSPVVLLWPSLTGGNALVPSGYHLRKQIGE